MSNDTVIILPPTEDKVVVTQPTIGTVLINQGAVGPEGPPGSGVTIGEVSATFNQSIPSNSWYITHNLGFQPSVTVVDTSGNVIEGDVIYVDPNHIRINFISAFSGTAYLS